VGPDCQPAKKKKKKEKKRKRRLLGCCGGPRGLWWAASAQEKKCGLPSCGPRRDSGGEGSGPVMGCLGLFSFLFFFFSFSIPFQIFFKPF
jgi:hypothetical protein